MRINLNFFKNLIRSSRKVKTLEQFFKKIALKAKSKSSTDILPLDHDRLATTVNVILGTYLNLLEFVKKELNQKELEFFSESLLVMLAHLNLNDPTRKSLFFEKAETYGVHFLPVHYYSPIPSATEIARVDFNKKYSSIPNLEMNMNQFKSYLLKLTPFFSELSNSFELNGNDPEVGYFWKNSAFCPLDACIYYSMIRYLKPNRVIEIGSGFSTLIAARALEANKSGKLECIEPFPSPTLIALRDKNLIELTIQNVQNTSIDKFSSLDSKDILFIDSTHVSKIGSDVNFEIFEILPSLKDGVKIHFHDIFHPSEYPEKWLKENKLFWNEQYLLQSFLAYNSRFKIQMANNFVSLEMRQLYEPFLPFVGESRVESGQGGSLWIEKI